jgi:LysR family transcriptional regulator, glycine cleavage system transcriptional activator
MFEHLPSLPALRVFEAAGRLLSFKAAATELHVTPSAVSRQIRALEAELATPLFRRLTRGIALTAEGVRYHAEVSHALANLDRASGSVRAARGRRPLRLSVLPSFAGNWLVPRIPRFEAAHPGLDVEMEATTAYADFARDDVDLAIRFGRGPWPGLHAERLVEIAFFPVASPGVAQGVPGLRRRRDLARHTWLEESHVLDAWSLWLETAGVPQLEPVRRLRYDNAQLLVDAAVAGQGVALVSDLLAERYLADGRLVRPFSVSAASPYTYHLVGRSEDLDEPRIRAFRSWMRVEAEAWQGRATPRARLR